MVKRSKRAARRRKLALLDSLLTACLWLAFAAAIAWFALPGAVPAARDAVSRIASDASGLKRAVEALGDAVSGERTLSGALSEAWRQAFETEPHCLEVSAGDLPEDELFSNPPSEPEDDSGDAGAVIGHTSAQELPKNASTERVDLGVEGTAPLMGTVTGGFGFREGPHGARFHYGLDIAAEEGSDVAVFADGTVEAVGDGAGYGLYMLVDHGSFRTLYAHLSEALVKSGDSVREGGVIAKSGGASLHFELVKDGVYLDPAWYV